MDDFDTRVSAYAVIVEGDRVLLAHFVGANGPAWTLPGGGVEVGEGPPEAAVREVHEETGYRAKLVRLLGLDSLHVRPADRIDGSKRALHALRVLYEARIVGGERRVEVNGSTDDARWVALSDIHALERVGLVDVGLHQWRDA